MTTPIRDRFAREYGITSEYDLAQLQAVLDEHGHQLAEEIRTTDLPEVHVDMFDNGTQWAADLIDPGEQR